MSKEFSLPTRQYAPRLWAYWKANKRSLPHKYFYTWLRQSQGIVGGQNFDAWFNKVTSSNRESTFEFKDEQSMLLFILRWTDT